MLQKKKKTNEFVGCLKRVPHDFLFFIQSQRMNFGLWISGPNHFLQPSNTALYFRTKFIGMVINLSRNTDVPQKEEAGRCRLLAVKQACTAVKGRTLPSNPSLSLISSISDGTPFPSGGQQNAAWHNKKHLGRQKGNRKAAAQFTHMPLFTVRNWMHLLL